MLFLFIAANDDFSPQNTTTITFSSGSLTNDLQCSNYLIIGDDLKEGPETFGVSLSAINSIDNVVGDPIIFVTIQDDGDGMFKYKSGIHAHTVWKVVLRKQFLPMHLAVIQDCGSPPVISNGNVDFNNHTLNGSLATYTCNNGYLLNGQDTITCLTNMMEVPGMWSADLPVCYCECSNEA